MKPTALLNSELFIEKSIETPSAPDAALRKFETMRPGAVPSGALRWKSAEEKGEQRRAWHLAVIAAHAKHPRVVLLAWVLMELSATDGFATAGDAYLASITKLPKKSIEAGLTQMERSGLIVRVHVPNPTRKSDFERRIYLAKAVIEKHASVSANRKETPLPAEGGDTPSRKGTEKKEGANKRYSFQRKRNHTVSEAARLDAERRAARARGESVNWLADAEGATASGGAGLEAPPLPLRAVA
jgi:hypothetical protein